MIPAALTPARIFRVSEARHSRLPGRGPSTSAPEPPPGIGMVARSGIGRRLHRHVLRVIIGDQNPGLEWKAMGLTEITGVVAVVVSVLYLGLQIRDNTKVLRSQAHYNALSLAQRPMEMMIENRWGWSSCGSSGWPCAYGAAHDLDITRG